MSGKLYLCATPIGNLEDITLRVLRTLKEVDLIAAEDTRNSIKLLNHFDIKTPMTSYHEYNKIEKAHTLIEKMQGATAKLFYLAFWHSLCPYSYRTSLYLSGVSPDINSCLCNG